MIAGKVQGTLTEAHLIWGDWIDTIFVSYDSYIYEIKFNSPVWTYIPIRGTAHGGSHTYFDQFPGSYLSHFFGNVQDGTYSIQFAFQCPPK